MMEPDQREDNVSQIYLSEQLEQTLPYGEYAYVKVIIIYWKESDKVKEYQKEAERLAVLFRDRFKFEVNLYLIPPICSHEAVRSYISDRDLGISTMTNANTPCLLIIHYGGHGDQDDDIHHPDGAQERRSVWRPNRSNGPSVKWYEIQQFFSSANYDVLLLLDCCYSAQAGRGQETIPKRIELLAACGSREDTPEPGDGSFTMVMINFMENSLDQQGYVKISELHTQLSHRKADLWTTPVYIKLRTGPTEASVKLAPLADLSKQQESKISWRSRVILMIHSPEVLDTVLMDRMVKWLRTDKPVNISLRVDRVLKTTAGIQSFIHESLPDKEGPLVKPLTRETLGKVRLVWNAIHTLIAEYIARHDDPLLEDDASQIAKEFLEQLETDNAKLLSILQQAILLSPECSETQNIDAAIQDHASDLLQMTDQLQLRRIICQAEQPNSSHVQNVSEHVDTDMGLTFEEEKSYGPHQSDSQIRAITARVGLLATLMKARKPDEFCCLPLVSCEHQEFQYRFVYTFQVPQQYGRTFTSLHSAIRDLTNEYRPTLDERFTMASCIAKAVEHWHTVNWVHQGICSHNIFLFTPRESNTKTRYDFSSPFLQGFDFSRPNAKPSLENHVEDLKYDVYRHPERQGPSREGHKKIHDLYSLGVVLLEIGTWGSAIDMIKRVTPEGRDVTKEDMFKWLKRHAKQRLAHHLGEEYQQAVMTCLNSDFGVSMDDDRNTMLANAFRERVLDKLASWKHVH